MEIVLGAGRATGASRAGINLEGEKRPTTGLTGTARHAGTRGLLCRAHSPRPAAVGGRVRASPHLMPRAPARAGRRRTVSPLAAMPASVGPDLKKYMDKKLQSAPHPAPQGSGSAPGG